jgi:thioredoxin-like negative regulator of GroEL
MVKATDINGKAIDMTALKKAKVGVVVLCANWNDNSMALNRQLSRLYKKAGGEMKVLTVCVDPEPTEMRRRIERDSLQWTVACDGKMFSSPLVRQLGLNNIPDNILLQNGRVVAHGMANPDLLKKIEDLLQ